MVNIGNLVEGIFDMKIGQDDIWYENMVMEKFNMKIWSQKILIWKWNSSDV